jgi:hypothetical protein
MLLGGFLHDVPNRLYRLYRHPISPRPAYFVDPAEQLSSINCGCGEPIRFSPNREPELYTGLGNKDKAFDSLEKSYVDRSINVAGSLKMESIYDPLRSDPRFADLLRRMNLQP